QLHLPHPPSPTPRVARHDQPQAAMDVVPNKLKPSPVEAPPAVVDAGPDSRTWMCRPPSRVAVRPILPRPRKTSQVLIPANSPSAAAIAAAWPTPPMNNPVATARPIAASVPVDPVDPEAPAVVEARPASPTWLRSEPAPTPDCPPAILSDSTASALLACKTAL